jgi:phage N-6-adenine-methyltransferase
MNLHNNKRSKDSLSDEWETPEELYEYIMNEIDFTPMLDVCATESNSKCISHIWKEVNAFSLNWNEDVFCNPPHSLTGKFVEYANKMWTKNNINIVMLIPTNTMSSIYFHKFIELEKKTTKLVDYFPLLGRIQFLKDGKPSEYKSRNAYLVVTFKKRS